MNSNNCNGCLLLRDQLNEFQDVIKNWFQQLFDRFDKTDSDICKFVSMFGAAHLTHPDLHGPPRGAFQMPPFMPPNGMFPRPLQFNRFEPPGFPMGNAHYVPISSGVPPGHFRPAMHDVGIPACPPMPMPSEESVRARVTSPPRPAVPMVDPTARPVPPPAPSEYSMDYVYAQQESIALDQKVREPVPAPGPVDVPGVAMAIEDTNEVDIKEEQESDFIEDGELPCTSGVGGDATNGEGERLLHALHADPLISNDLRQMTSLKLMETFSNEQIRIKNVAQGYGHVTSHEVQMFECRLCGKLFSKSFFTTHLRTVHFGERWRCTLCQESFMYRSNTIKHVKEKHGPQLGANVIESFYLNSENGT